MSKPNFSNRQITDAEWALIQEVRDIRKHQDPIQTYVHTREIFNDHLLYELQEMGCVSEEIQLTQAILIKISHRILQTVHPVPIYPGDEAIFRS